MRRARFVVFGACFAAAAGTVRAAEPPAPPAKAPAVAASTKTARGATIADIYPAEKLRDPFMERGGGGAPAPKPAETGGEPEAFNIHSLTLKGVMGGKGGDFALIVDPSGASYVLKRGRLYDEKNKPVPGVTGVVKVKQKTVYLKASDNDVQTLILGEEEGI